MNGLNAKRKKSIAPDFKKSSIALALGMAVLGDAQSAMINVGLGCSLNDAIISANSNTASGGCIAGDLAGTDEIILPASTVFSVSTPAAVYQTSLGISALPIISSDISIQGNGSTIQRTSADPFRVIYVDVNGVLALTSITITGGNASGAGPSYNFNYGGGIRNLGSLTLDSSTVSGSTALRRGGGIHNRGSLTINNSEISTNTALGQGGGGVSNGNGGSLLIQNSSVSMNTAGIGGGIEGYFGQTISIINSSITLNGSSANGQGGGMSIAETDVSIDGSTIANNIVNTGSRGGGVQMFENNTATQNSLIISNSTITGNTGGDGVYSSTYTKISNSSITLNGGTGIEHRGGNAVFESLTITGNAGIGISSSGPNSSLTAITVTGNESGMKITGNSTLLQDVVVSGNLPGGGGYASMTGNITVNNLMIDSNVSTYGFGGVSVGGDIITIEDITATNNTGGAGGGFGITHDGSNAVTVNNIQATDNVSFAGSGGLVVGTNSGTLTLTNTVVTGNSADLRGGGVIAVGGVGGTIILDGIQILNNVVSSASLGRKSGGGIYANNLAGSLVIVNSQISNNDAYGCGGVCVNGTGSLEILNTTISNNKSLATNQSGGGVYIAGSITAKLADSTISENVASRGAGVYLQTNNVNLVNLTVSGNTASDQGGAAVSVSDIRNLEPKPTLRNSTLINNVQNGVFGAGGIAGEIEVSSTVIAGSTGVDCYLTPFSFRNPIIGVGNWFEDASCDGIAQGDPMLDVLANNGGDTLTHLPLLNSGLIDAAGQCGVEFDQIGAPRSVCKCDVGAIEVLELQPDDSSCTGQFFVVPTSNGNMVIFEL